MTFNERAARASAIETATQVVHEQLDAALQVMDYACALELQMQVDRLRRKAQQIRRRHWWRAAEHLKNDDDEECVEV